MFPSPAQRTFRDSLTWRIVAAIPFLIALVIAIAVYMEIPQIEPISWSFVAFFGLLFIYACVWAAKRRISIHAEGITYKSMTDEKDLRWDEITETCYGQQQVNMYAHFGLIGLLLSLMKGQNLLRSLEIVGPRKIKITSNIRDNQEAISAVLAAVNPRLQKEAERVLGSGGTVSFGNLSLTSAGVVWKGKDPIPYSAIAKCRIDGSFLRIKAEGKWLDNVAVTVKKVPNVFVFLDMVQQRCETFGQKAAAAIAGSSASQYLG